MLTFILLAHRCCSRLAIFSDMSLLKGYGLVFLIAHAAVGAINKSIRNKVRDFIRDEGRYRPEDADNPGQISLCVFDRHFCA